MLALKPFLQALRESIHIFTGSFMQGSKTNHDKGVISGWQPAPATVRVTEVTETGKRLSCYRN